MNILYDMSVFGYAHRYERARTGIYRVVENVACGVLASGECSLVGYSSQGNDDDCLEYLAGHPQLSVCSHGFVRGIAGCERISFPHASIIGLARKLVHCLRSSGKDSAIRLPDIDLCHTPSYPLPLSIVNHPAIATVQTVYDLIPILFPQYFEFDESSMLRTVIERLSLQTQVICISESTKNDLCNFASRLDPSQVHVTHLAASESFYPCGNETFIRDVRQRYGIPEDARYVLSVCTLEPRKNIDMVIRCFAKLALEERLSDLYLVLTGAKGWHFDHIFDEIGAVERLRERIILTGFVPDEDLAPLYSGALAFVYPSLYEGFGLPPLEAMQCGTPVITSNTSSLPEVVGDAGIMVDPKDGDALCQAMLDLYREESLRLSFSRRALTRAAEFSWKRCVDQTLAVYRKAREAR